MYLHARYRKDVRRHWKIPINNNICYNFITVHLVLAAAQRGPFPLCEVRQRVELITFWQSFTVSRDLTPSFTSELLEPGNPAGTVSHTAVGISLPSRLRRARSEHQKVAARTRLKPTERCQKISEDPHLAHIFYLTFE